MILNLSLRLIDRQVHNQTIVEVWAGPDSRRVRFWVDLNRAVSELWTPQGWTEIHQIIGTLLTLPEENIQRLFKPTLDILGWKQEEGSLLQATT